MRKTNYKIIVRSKFDDTLNRLLDKQDFFFIQIGANDGVRFDDLYLKVTQHNIHGIVIEPIQKYYKRLALNYEDYPGVKCLNLALHPSNTTVEIFHVNDKQLPTMEPWRGGVGSIYKSHLINNHTPNHCITSTRVASISMRGLIESYDVKKVDLLQIDVEGFDLEIIKMVPFDQIQPSLIKFEYVNLTCAQKRESLEILRKNGYKTYIENENAIGILNADVRRC